MYRHAISLWQTVLYSAKLLIFARYSKQIMQKTQNIRIEDFNYPLPDERIAKFPLSKRDDSKLLVYRKGEIEEHRFHELPKVLPADSLLVFNNTRVIQARLHFRKETGALIEVFCLEPLEPHEYSLSFQSTGSCSWLCLVGNLKKWKNGVLTQSVNIDGKTVNFRAERGCRTVMRTRCFFVGRLRCNLRHTARPCGRIAHSPLSEPGNGRERQNDLPNRLFENRGFGGRTDRRTTFYSGSTEQTERKEHTHSRTDFTRGSRYIQTGKKRNSRRARDAHRIYLGEPQPHR